MKTRFSLWCSCTLHMFFGVALLLLCALKIIIFLENTYLDYKDSKIRSKCVISTKHDVPNDVFLRSSNAGCLVEQDGKILFVVGGFNFEDLKRKGLLFFPGGTKNRGEYAACTAARETKEEANIDVTVVDFVGILENDFSLFLCKTSKRISDSDLSYVKRRETDGMEFVSIEDVINLNPEVIKRFKYPSDIKFLSEYYKERLQH